ncbi:thioesterase domain-containing protein, partial [Aquimarina spongiae]
GDDHLVGYYVPSSSSVNVSDIKSYLQDRLPDYMVPSYYVALSSLPLTSNGKIDRSVLPIPSLEDVASYQAAETLLESKLVDIWSDVLGLEASKISVTRSFFELGGHSLKATKLVYKIKEELGVTLSVVDIFSKPTIRELSQKMEKANIAAVHIDESVILLKESTNQLKNLFFIHDGGGDVQGYIQLSQWIQNYNCYGIRSNTLNDLHPVDLSIQDIAYDYIQILKTIQPEGPYTIIGWSLGGVIACEITKQLENAGEKVDKLILIDTVIKQPVSNDNKGFDLVIEKDILRSIIGNIPGPLLQAQKVEEFWQVLLGLIHAEEISFDVVKKAIPENIQRLMSTLDQQNAEKMIKTFNTVRSLDQAMLSYTVEGKIDATLVYIIASDSGLDHKTLLDKTKRLIVEKIEGDHFSIMKFPQVKVLATVLESMLLQEEHILVSQQ